MKAQMLYKLKTTDNSIWNPIRYTTNYDDGAN